MLGGTAKTNARQDKVWTQVEGETVEQEDKILERCELSGFAMSWIVCSRRRCMQECVYVHEG